MKTIKPWKSAAAVAATGLAVALTLAGTATPAHADGINWGVTIHVGGHHNDYDYREDYRYRERYRRPDYDDYYYRRDRDDYRYRRDRDDYRYRERDDYRGRGNGRHRGW